MIPYGKQTIEQDDLDAVAEVLRSDWLTQGPKVAEFEEALGKYCGARHCVVFSNGTAALQAAYYAAGLGPGDEFITSPLTFASTANAGIWQGAKPVFVDIDPATGNINPALIAAAATSKTKAIVPVDFAGLAADLDPILKEARQRGLVVIEDACHSLGASYKGKPVGGLSDMTVLSFHPVKSITTGEGGAVLTNDSRYFEKLKLFRTHGITKENLVFPGRHESWYYEMQELGLNYRLTDIQCALGISQLKKLNRFVAKRREIAQRYHKAWKNIPDLILPPQSALENSSWHLYVIRLAPAIAKKRDFVFGQLKARGIGAQVHYIPVYWHPYYETLGYKPGLCPRAEEFFQASISLPIYPLLTEKDQLRVIEAVGEILSAAAV